VFADDHADVSRIPFILPEWEYFFENPYNSTDPSFSECAFDRPRGGSPDGRLYIVNHMLHLQLDLIPDFPIQIPYALRSFQTNSVRSITAQASLCYRYYGRLPNVVLVGFQVTRGKV
jgi:hypothetical protein